MNLKKIKFLSIIFVFLLCFPFHFIYNLVPCKLTSIFFPVNESIWEHMKMISSSFLVWSLFEYLIIKKYNIKVNNYIFNILVLCTLSIVVFLILYLPFYYLIGENLIITLILLFINICVTEYISFKIFIMKKNYNLNIVSIILIILLYVFYGYLTYKPFINDLFFDKSENIYGINTFKL